MDDDEIGFDEAASEETSSVPGVVTPLQKHADLIKWAKSKYLDVDPQMGRAEPIAKKMIRVLARRLISDGEYMSRRLQEGATASELSWSVQETDEIEKRLQALKGSL